MEKILKCGSSSALVKSAGAELKSFAVNGRELMWEGNPAYWNKTSPVLFPAIGGLKNGKTIIDGIEYSMTKHGFARDNEFVCVNETEDSATFSLSENEETLKMFPFRFDLRMTYKLKGESLEILYEVHNKSDIPMPFCIGAHPAFACPAEGKKFSDYRLVFQEKETVCSPVLDVRTRLLKESGKWRLKNSSEFKLDYPLFDDDVVYFRNIVSKSVCLLDDGGKGVKVSWEGFRSLGVWTPAGKNAPFICLEPWCGCDDYENTSGNFRDKPEIQTCLPDGTNFYTMTIEAV